MNYNYTKSLIFASMMLIFSVFLSSCQSSTSDCQGENFLNSTHRVSHSDAQNMEDLYIANHYIPESSNFPNDHREYWFSLEDLKDYICYLNYMADSLKYDKNQLGIRIYNGAVSTPKGLKSNVFIIGTYKDPNAPENDQNMNIMMDAFDYGSSGEPAHPLNNQ